MKQQNKVFLGIACAILMTASMASAAVEAVAMWEPTVASTETWPLSAPVQATGITASWSNTGLTLGTDSSRTQFTKADGETWTAATDYIEIAVTIAPQTTVQWDKFLICMYANRTVNTTLTWSVDNYASTLGTFASPSNYENFAVDLSGQAASTAGVVTFRLGLDATDTDDTAYILVCDTDYATGGDPLTSGYNLAITGTVPEPATMSLLALGGMAMLRRKRKA